MLPKKERLSKAVLASVLDRPRVLRSPLFVAKWKQNTVGHHRFAVVVSKSVCKEAVDRNHKRRQVYEAIHHYPMVPGYGKDVVLFGQKPLAHASYQNISDHILSLFTKLFG